MTKTPTAEEVLAKYQRVIDARTAMQTNPLGPRAGVRVWRDSKEEFMAEVERWLDSHGPVTREWFEERFGGFHPGIEIVFDRENGPELVCRKCGRWIRLVNPTRSKIEALVEMLGGEANGS